MIGPHAYLNDEYGQAAVGLLAGQALCLAVEFRIGAIWLSSNWSGWVLGLGVIVALAIQGSTSWIGLRRLQAIALKRHANAETRAKSQHEDLQRTQRAVMYGLAHLSESRDRRASAADEALGSRSGGKSANASELLLSRHA